MKKIIFLICIVSLSACEKYPFLPDKYSEVLFGTWHWKGTACYFGGSYQSADSAGYSLKMTFDRHRKYNVYKNDTLIMDSKYHLDLPEKHENYNIYKLTIEKEKNEYRILIIGDTLGMSPFGMYDACESIYIKQK